MELSENRFFDVDYVLCLKYKIEKTLCILKKKNIKFNRKDLAKKIGYNYCYMSKVLNGYLFSKNIVIALENWLLEIESEI